MLRPNGLSRHAGFARKSRHFCAPQHPQNSQQQQHSASRGAGGDHSRIEKARLGRLFDLFSTSSDREVAAMARSLVANAVAQNKEKPIPVRLQGSGPHPGAQQRTAIAEGALLLLQAGFWTQSLAAVAGAFGHGKDPRSGYSGGQTESRDEALSVANQLLRKLLAPVEQVTRPSGDSAAEEEERCSTAATVRLALAKYVRDKKLVASPAEATLVKILGAQLFDGSGSPETDGGDSGAVGSPFRAMSTDELLHEALAVGGTPKGREAEHSSQRESRMLHVFLELLRRRQMRRLCEVVQRWQGRGLLQHPLCSVVSREASALISADSSAKTTVEGSEGNQDQQGVLLPREIRRLDHLLVRMLALKGTWARACAAFPGIFLGAFEGVGGAQLAHAMAKTMEESTGDSRPSASSAASGSTHMFNNFLMPLLSRRSSGDADGVPWRAVSKLITTTTRHLLSTSSSSREDANEPLCSLFNAMAGALYETANDARSEMMKIHQMVAGAERPAVDSSTSSPVASETADLPRPGSFAQKRVNLRRDEKQGASCSGLLGGEVLEKLADGFVVTKQTKSVDAALDRIAEVSKRLLAIARSVELLAELTTGPLHRSVFHQFGHQSPSQNSRRGASGDSRIWRVASHHLGACAGMALRALRLLLAYEHCAEAHCALLRSLLTMPHRCGGDEAVCLLSRSSFRRFLELNVPVLRLVLNEMHVEVPLRMRWGRSTVSVAALCILLVPSTSPTPGGGTTLPAVNVFRERACADANRLISELVSLAPADQMGGQSSVSDSGTEMFNFFARGLLGPSAATSISSTGEADPRSIGTLEIPLEVAVDGVDHLLRPPTVYKNMLKLLLPDREKAWRPPRARPVGDPPNPTAQVSLSAEDDKWATDAEAAEVDGKRGDTVAKHVAVVASFIAAFASRLPQGRYSLKDGQNQRSVLASHGVDLVNFFVGTQDVDSNQRADAVSSDSEGTSPAFRANPTDELVAVRELMKEMMATSGFSSEGDQSPLPSADIARIFLDEVPVEQWRNDRQALLHAVASASTCDVSIAYSLLHQPAYMRMMGADVGNNRSGVVAAGGKSPRGAVVVNPRCIGDELSFFSMLALVSRVEGPDWVLFLLNERLRAGVPNVTPWSAGIAVSGVLRFARDVAALAQKERRPSTVCGSYVLPFLTNLEDVLQTPRSSRVSNESGMAENFGTRGALIGVKLVRWIYCLSPQPLPSNSSSDPSSSATSSSTSSTGNEPDDCALAGFQLLSALFGALRLENKRLARQRSGPKKDPDEHQKPRGPVEMILWLTFRWTLSSAMPLNHSIYVLLPFDHRKVLFGGSNKQRLAVGLRPPEPISVSHLVVRDEESEKPKNSAKGETRSDGTGPYALNLFFESSEELFRAKHQFFVNLGALVQRGQEYYATKLQSTSSDEGDEALRRFDEVIDAVHSFAHSQSSYAALAEGLLGVGEAVPLYSLTKESPR